MISTTRASLQLVCRPAVLTTRRCSSTQSTTPVSEEDQALSPRWLTDVKQRIGHCITFGLTYEQKDEAGQILQILARDWRELLAGSEGYLTDQSRRSIFRREVVWGEMDSMGHVNNVVYNRWAESGRVNWARKYATHIDPRNANIWSELWTPRGEGLILRKITTEFKFPMTFPDHVTVYHRLSSEPQEGTDTFDMHVIMLSERHQRPVARCIEDGVLYDYRRGKKIALPPFMLEVLQKTWHLQEEARTVNHQRVRELLHRVRQLELTSWDRADAVEEFGSNPS